MQVYLSENVFLGMILSAIEVYKSECYGLLLGLRTNEKFVIDYAIPYQSAKRGRTWAELRQDKWMVISKIVKNFPKLDVIGDFHSHTMFGESRADIVLGREDVEYMSENELQIVVAINDKIKSQVWDNNRDGTISGTIDRYHCKVAAYYLPNSDKSHQPKLAEIYCPFAVGLLVKGG
ncbi:MAG: hypothetical protein JSU92_15225 [Deltaproteobacteria bacterium]|nr:MAG: hypothetical protein JSU92_15225 [Deltaproteobacteria bacterium]